MPRQYREAPGCYVPSGGLSHLRDRADLRYILLSEKLPFGCRTNPVGGTAAHVPQLYQIHVEHTGRTIGGVSTHLRFHVLHAYRTPKQSGRG